MSSDYCWQVSDIVSVAKRERRALSKKLSEISNYGISVWNILPGAHALVTSFTKSYELMASFISEINAIYVRLICIILLNGDTSCTSLFWRGEVVLSVQLFGWMTTIMNNHIIEMMTDFPEFEVIWSVMLKPYPYGWRLINNKTLPIQ